MLYNNNYKYNNNNYYYNINRFNYSKEISYKYAKEIIDSKACTLIDVRNRQEYREGHLKNSINIPFYEITINNRELKRIGGGPIILYCQSGKRSKKVCEKLYQLGYRNLYSILGGLDSVDKRDIYY